MALAAPPAQSADALRCRPYLPLGSLRDQVIYPDSKEDMLAKGRTDVDLYRILQARRSNISASLTPIVGAPGVSC